jgi:hypothetical protein
MAFQHVDPATKAALVYATKEEANEHKPEGKPKFKVFQVTSPNHPPRFVWSGSAWDALRIVAVADGYSAASIGALPTPEKALSILNQLSAEDRAAVVAQLTGSTEKRKGK